MLRLGDSRRKRDLRAAERDIRRAKEERRIRYNFSTRGPQNPKEARKAIRDTHDLGREISEYLPEAKDRSKLLPYLTHSTLEPPPTQDMRHTICLPKNNTVFRTQKDASGCGPFVSQEDENELCCTQQSDSVLCASVFAILNGTTQSILRDPHRVGRIEREMYAWMKELNPGMLPVFPVVNIDTDGGAGDEALMKLAIKTRTSARIEIGLHLENQDLPVYPYQGEIHAHDDTVASLRGDVRIYAHTLEASLSFDAFRRILRMPLCRELRIDCPIDCTNINEHDVAELVGWSPAFMINSNHDTFSLQFGLPDTLQVMLVGAELIGLEPPLIQWYPRPGFDNGPTSTCVRDGEVEPLYVTTCDYLTGNRICIRGTRG